MQRNVILSATFLLLLVLAACQETETTFGLDEASTPTAQEDEARRALMNLRVLVGNATVPVEKTPSEVANYVKDDCIATLTGSAGLGRLPAACATVGNYTTSTLTCDVRLCQLQLELCRSHRLLEIATSPSATVLFTTAGAKAATVMPVNSAEAAGMAELSLTFARTAAVAAGSQLRIVTGDTTVVGAAGTYCTNAILATSFGSNQPSEAPTLQTYGASVAASLAESTRLMFESVDVAVRENVAVADATYDVEPQLRKAAGLAQVGSYLSRSHAAHLLVGGREAPGTNLPGALSVGLYRQPPLSERGKIARRLIQESGISPATLGSNASINDVLVGGGVADPLRVRLGDRWQISTAPTGVFKSTTTAPAFAAMFGIGVDDFTEARTSIVEEQRIEGTQGNTTLLPVQLLPGGGTPLYTRYASTVNSGSMQTGARMREAASRSNIISGSVNDDRNTPASPPNDWDTTRSFSPTKASYVSRGASAALDYAYSTAHYVLTGAVVTEPTTKAILAQLVGEGRRVRPRRVETAYRYNGSVDLVRIRVMADPVPPTGTFILVDTEEAVQCATEGTVHGAPCNMASFWTMAVTTIANTMAMIGTNDTGFPGYHEFNITTGLLPFPGKTFYVLEKKSTGTSAAGPRGYVVVSGARIDLQGTTSTWIHLDMDSVIPELDIRADGILVPVVDPAEAGAPAAHDACSGLFGRIPLEDELTEDNNDVESSWRSHLARARTAADRADRLGEEIIAEGLEMDRRAEEGVKELERLCGASINVSHLPTAGLPVPTSTVCATDADCTGICGECIAFRCTETAVGRAICQAAGDPDAARLLECVGSDTIVPLVSLGTNPVCIWRSTTNPNAICEGSTAAARCPFFGKPTTPSTPADCTFATNFPTAFVPPVGVATEEVTRRLNLFASSGQRELVSPPPGTACEWIRYVRRPAFYAVPGAIEEIVDQITAARLFEGASMRPVVERIGWRAEVGDRAEVTLNGTSWFSTGDWRQTSYVAGDPWPCGTGAYPNTVPGDLFNLTSQCASPATRQAFNNRVRNAAMMARAMFGATYDGIDAAVTGALAAPGTLLDEEVSGAITRRSHLSGPDRRECFVGAAAWQGAANCSIGNSVFGSAAYGTDGLAPAGWVSRHAFAPRPGSLKPRLRAAGANMNAGFRVFDHIDRGTFLEDRAFFTSQYALHTTENVGTFLDAMELACEATNVTVGSACAGSPPIVNNVNDMSKLNEYLRCMADDVQRRGELTLIANVPTRVVDALTEVGGTGGFPATGGTYSETLSSARANLEQVATVPGLLASTMRSAASDMELVRIALGRNDIARQQAEVQFRSQAVGNAAACASAAAGAVSLDFGSAATCANAVAQTVFANQLSLLTAEDLGLADDSAFETFKSNYEERTRALASQSLALRTAHEALNANMASLEATRTAASRYAAQITLADSDAMGRQFNVNTVMRRRMNARLFRYNEARKDAVLAAHVAKLAVEQRLGVRLADLRDDMSLVDAPSTWEASVCTSTGVDYEALRDSTDLSAENLGETGAFVGDYVTKLENVVASYSIDFPFSVGTDTAVFSLRDDIMSIRQACDVPVDNLLLQTNDLAASPMADGTGGWAASRTDATACALSCAAASTTPGAETPFVTDPGTRVFGGGPRAFQVRFGSGAVVAPGAALSQRVVLEPGWYRLSWYAKQVAPGPLASDAMDARLESAPGTSLIVTTRYQEPNSALNMGWQRWSARFEITSSAASTVRVSILRSTSTAAHTVLIAGPMLEDLSDDRLPADLSTAYPKPYVPTVDASVATLNVCQDSEGIAFRGNDRWKYRCQTLCDAGFNASCSPDAARSYCFWETEFSLSQESIENGTLGTGGGFARGNFNYRFDSIALNAIGSTTRDCSDLTIGTGCYTTAAIPYSIEHGGTYAVRNYSGGVYNAPLFVGRIEHARALAAERYLTNPLSSADRALVEPYTRRELRGRPLDGVYVLRVWDEPGVNFDGIEDIQILVNYRYWTRNGTIGEASP